MTCDIFWWFWVVGSGVTWSQVVFSEDRWSRKNKKLKIIIIKITKKNKNNHNSYTYFLNIFTNDISDDIPLITWIYDRNVPHGVAVVNVQLTTESVSTNFNYLAVFEKNKKWWCLSYSSLPWSGFSQLLLSTASRTSTRSLQKAPKT